MLVHLDAYRLNSPAEFDALLLDDFLKPPYCLAIEWPEKIGDRLPGGALHVAMGIAPDRRHTIRVD
jgi:tRNA threonylcarbamoyladenosine biosynthesis protein TsaE